MVSFAPSLKAGVIHFRLDLNRQSSIKKFNRKSSNRKLYSHSITSKI
jgi:hypothetical protein